MAKNTPKDTISSVENAPVTEENQGSEQQTLNEIIDEVVTEVSPPSPVADMAGIGGMAAGGSAIPPMPVSNPDGMASGVSPQAEKRGRGRPKKDGSQPKPSGAASPRPNLNGVNNGAIPPVNDSLAAIEPCAQMAVMLVNVSGMAMGGEAAAMKSEEAILAKGGFVAYFKAKGVDSVPPWVILAGSLCPYYLRIMTTTPAKSTISTAFGRLWFKLKEMRKQRKNARSDNRHNIKRENDTSADNGAKSA